MPGSVSVSGSKVVGWALAHADGPFGQMECVSCRAGVSPAVPLGTASRSTAMTRSDLLPQAGHVRLRLLNAPHNDHPCDQSRHPTGKSPAQISLISTWAVICVGSMRWAGRQ